MCVCTFCTHSLIEVLKEDPEDFLATCVKAKCLFMMGDFEMSLMVWHKARKMRGNVGEVMQDKGLAFFIL